MPRSGPIDCWSPFLALIVIVRAGRERGDGSLSGDVPQDVPKGVVPLSAAIAAWRDELMQAWQEGQGQRLRFKPSPVELTLQVAVTSAGKGNAGVRWWLIELGGEVSRESAVTQTVKLTLNPIMMDDSGRPVEVLIDTIRKPFGLHGDGEIPLDTVG